VQEDGEIENKQNSQSKSTPNSSLKTRVWILLSSDSCWILRNYAGQQISRHDWS